MDLRKDSSATSLKRIIVIAGSVVAYYMGAGYATGQEMLQYRTGYGMISMFSGLLYFLFYWYVNHQLIKAGHEGQFEGGMRQICRYYCGKYIGTFYEYFSSFFCYLCFIVMCAGGGAVLKQQYGLPEWVGIAIIAVTALFSTFFGLSKLVDIIGNLGPVLIILCLVFAFIGIFMGETGLAEGDKLAQELDIMRAKPTWWEAIINEAGFAILWMIGFFGGIGREEPSLKNAQYGNVLGLFFVALAFAVVTLSEIANVELVWDSQVPLLLIIGNINPTIATIYAIVVFLGVYTTAGPLLWTGARCVSEEGTNRYKILIVVGAAVGFFVATLLPFNRLVNIIYVLNGYVGFIFFLFMVIKHIRTVVEKRSGTA